MILSLLERRAFVLRPISDEDSPSNVPWKEGLRQLYVVATKSYIILIPRSSDRRPAV